MITLENWRYLVQFGCIKDCWRLNGNVYGHPNHDEGASIFPSTPKSLDRETRILTTVSGTQYYLGNAEGDENEWFAQLEKDIERGGFEYI